MVAFFEMARARGLGVERDPGGTVLVLLSSLCGIALFERVGVHGGRFPRVLIERVVARVWPDGGQAGPEGPA